MALDPNSIVDYLKSKGQASDQQSRVALGTKHGISGIAGANNAAGNTALLAALRGTENSNGATDPARASYVNNISKNPDASTSSTAGKQTDSSSTAAPTAPESPFKSYKDYMSKYATSLSETADKTALNSIESDIEKIDLQARRAYEATLDTPGMLKGGAESAATRGRRRSNAELADLAIQQSGAARSYGSKVDANTAKSNYFKNMAELSKPQQVGDTYYDPTTGKVIPNTKTPAAFELSPGQSRYTYDPKTGKYVESASKPATPKAPTAGDKKDIMVTDVNSAVSQLGTIVKTSGAKGVSPDDYATMRAYMQETYGYEGVKELDAAMTTLGLSVLKK